MTNNSKILLGCLIVLLLVLLGSALVVGGVLLTRMNPVASQPVAASNTMAQPSPPPSLLNVGSPAPDFTLTDLNKQTFHLSDLNGKAVMLNFWATWCAPCSAEMPNIQKVYGTVDKQKVAIYAVNQGEMQDQVKGYADLFHLNFPILLDSSNRVAEQYRVQALPTTVFIDSKGIVRQVHVGGPMSADFIQNQINQLLGK